MEASWQPDPTGRHQYRWWDGAGWTESVADDGQTSTDSQWSAAPPTVVASQQPYGAPESPPAAAPSGPLPNYAASQQPVKKGGAGKWIALAAVGVVALAIGAFFVLSGGDDAGGGSTGKFTFELTDDERVVTKDIPMKPGEAVRIRVEPPGGMDTKSVLLLSVEDANAEASAGVELLSEFYSDSDPEEVLSEFFSEARDVFTDGELESELRRGYGYPLDDDGDEGQPDTGGILGLATATYHLVIGADDENANGKITVYVERYEGDSLTDLEDLSDVTSDDPFFTDSAFFSDSEPYSPGS